MGLPPVQFAGEEEIIVLVCWLLTQVLQPEYVHEVQVGGVYVHDCVKIGFPPEQPLGDAEITVLDCVPLG